MSHKVNAHLCRIMSQGKMDLCREFNVLSFKRSDSDNLVGSDREVLEEEGIATWVEEVKLDFAIALEGGRNTRHEIETNFITTFVGHKIDRHSIIELGLQENRTGRGR